MASLSAASSATATSSHSAPAPDGAALARPASSLFWLPKELRLIIYELLLRLPVAVRDRPGLQTVRPNLFAILRVSREIYSEAKYIFYETNRFYSPNTTALHTLLSRPAAQHLRHVSFAYRIGDTGSPAAFALLSRTQVKRVGILGLEVDFMPHMAILAAMRSLEEVKLFGDCELTAKHFVRANRRVYAEGKAVEGPVEGEDDGDLMMMMD